MNDCLRLRPQGRFRLIAMDTHTGLAAFARNVRKGLTSRPKQLSCCYFYDREGSLLFEEICELPEYYLPAAERSILNAHAAEIADSFPDEAVLVELGSGNAAKTRLLIDAFLGRQPTLRYVPVDISRTALEDSSRLLLQEYPGLEILAVAGEYHEGLRHLQAAGPQAKLILWLGSNVGNFNRDEATHFLGKVRQTMSPADRLLAGIDLRKERHILKRAYDDSRGVTANSTSTSWRGSTASWAATSTWIRSITARCTTKRPAASRSIWIAWWNSACRSTSWSWKSGSDAARPSTRRTPTSTPMPRSRPSPTPPASAWSTTGSTRAGGSASMCWHRL